MPIGSKTFAGSLGLKIRFLLLGGFPIPYRWPGLRFKKVAIVSCLYRRSINEGFGGLLDPVVVL